MQLPITAYDAAWKYFADNYLADLLAYTFPAVHARIDWQQPPLILDGELARFGIDGPDTLRSDKLVQVRTSDAQPQTILLLLEIQSQVDRNFTQRLARYAARIAERYGLPLVPLVILADRNRRWRPPHFDGGYAGVGPMVYHFSWKLLDTPLDAVLADPRLAALFDLMIRFSWTRRDDDARLTTGAELALRLYRTRPHPERELLDLLRLMHLVLPLSAARYDELVPTVMAALRKEGFMLEHRVLAGFEIVAEERGEARGKEIGKEIGQRELLLRQLERRCGSLSDADRLALLELPAARLPDLAEAIFDFQHLADLQAWLTAAHE